MSQQISSIISRGTIVTGEVRSANGTIEVYGTFNGQLVANNLIIHGSGHVTGEIKARNITTSGTLDGEINAKELLDIEATGSVNGNIRYGHLAMKEGGQLTADLRNVPPSLGGDNYIFVSKGKAVRLTTDDLTAIDPDDKPADLSFAVSDMKNGFVVCMDAPKVAAKTFTQEALEKGKIVFVHDGKEAKTASFAVRISDKAGAVSGKPRIVEVEVRS